MTMSALVKALADRSNAGIRSAAKLLFDAIAAASGVPTSRTLTIGPTTQDLSANRTFLASVTNDAQTKATVVPNTAPLAGQVLFGNAGGTAYAKQTITGSGATISCSSAGVITISGIANASLTNSAITISGTSTSLGGTIARDDVVMSVPANGLVQRTGTNAFVAKTAPVGAVVGDSDTQTLISKTISADNNTLSGIAASSFVLSNGSGNIDGSAAQKVIPSGVVVGDSDTQTLTNKRINKRVTTTVNATGTISTNADTDDIRILTAATGNLTISAPTGTPTEGQLLSYRIYDNGVSRTITWNAAFRTPTTGTFGTLPPSTGGSSQWNVDLEWNSTDSKWDCLSAYKP